ncbi:MAG: glycosyltransferase [Sediminicola sp.]
MKTLLQINIEVNYGSTGRIAENIGAMAIEQGWESYIAYGRNHRPSASKLIPIGGKWEQYLHVLQTRLLDRHGLGSKRATKTLIAQLERLSPDLIHLHNIHGYYIHIPLLFTYLAEKNIPVIWTLHDCWALTGHCTHFEYVGCQKWQGECSDCPQLRAYPSSLLADRSTKNHRAKKALIPALKNLTLVPVSQWLEDRVKESFLAHCPSQVIPNGVDTKVFAPAPDPGLRERFGLQDKFLVLGVASVWSKNKGMRDFLNLARIVGPDTAIVLIGLNEDQLKELPKNMIGIKRTDSVAELAQWYSTADVYLNTSVEESFGLTNAEALSCGTPIIVYNATALPEMVTPQTGAVVEKHDIRAIKEALATIQEKGKPFYAEACSARANNLYDKQKNYRSYLQLYDSLKK